MSSVIVLLATYNGLPYIRQQLDSVLGQTGVEVRVVAVDDDSTDGTADYLAGVAASDPRLTVHNAAKNLGYPAVFFHLVAEIRPEPDQWVAFCDQDDVWAPDKLARQLAQARQHRVGGVSSSITSVYQDGRRVLVRKDTPQRRLDFICETPGPGATFLLSPDAYALVARYVRDHLDELGDIGFHDTLIYALVRAAGLGWYIGSQPTIDYRQHEGNTMGANIGWAAAGKRARMLSSGWYRQQFGLLTKASLAVSTPDLVADLGGLAALLRRHDLAARLRLAGMCRFLRRRRRDQVLLGGGVILGRW